MTDDGGEFSREGPWKFLHQYLRPADHEAGGLLTFPEILNALQKRMRPFLKANGFYGKGRNFNRTSEDGLVQVVNFQLARFGPIEDYDPETIEDSLYGRFTINLGIFVPEAHEIFESYKIGSPIPEVSCHVRARLGELGPERDDLWWSIRDEDVLAVELQERLERDGFPYFAQYASRDLCLANAHIGDMSEFCHLPRIVSAAIFNKRGSVEAAFDLIVDQLRSVETQHPHAHYVRRLARKMGLGDLPD